MTQALSPEIRAVIAQQLGDAKPAQDGLLVSFGKAIADRRDHEHPKWEDLFCLNLSSYMGERAAPVLRRLLDAEAQRDDLRDRFAEAVATVTRLEQKRVELERIANAERARVAELEAARSTDRAAALIALALAMREEPSYDLASKIEDLGELVLAGEPDEIAALVDEITQLTAMDEVAAGVAKSLLFAAAEAARLAVTRELEAGESASLGEPDFFQPGRTYCDSNGYRAPELTAHFRVEHVTRHPERGHLRAIGWLRTGAPGARWHGDFRDEGQFDGWTDITDPREGGER
ncbi:hypothetical protein [Streptomyces sp. NPDC057617]|uniref:hypothetical protein n=1 Tax=Streptomyces sp. NPDC057617 TaxID=3346184 RepID=UPI003687764F